MRRMVQLLFAIIIVATSNNIAQEFEVPKDYKLKNKEDYKKYESDALRCIEYFETSSLDDSSKEKGNAYKFLLQWIIGTPYVTINISSIPTELSKENKDFLLIFMGGWTKKSLLEQRKLSDVEGNLAGIESVLKVYKNSKGVKKDEKIEELIRLKEENKLTDWVKEQLEKS